jgi:hypothetical protein
VSDNPEHDIDLLIAIVGRLQQHVEMSKQLAQDAMEIAYRLLAAKVEPEPEPDVYQRWLAAVRAEVLGP